MNEDTMALDFQTLTLERLRFAQMQRVSRGLLRDAEVQVVADHTVDMLAIRLETQLLADRLDPSNTSVPFKVWASTWQHVKASAFPTFSRWLRRPPRSKVVSVDVTADNFATFPESSIAYPSDLGRPVRLSIMRPPPFTDLT